MSNTFQDCGLGSFISFCIGLVLFIIGFGAPYWQTSIREYQGLWRYCYVDFNVCENFIGSNALGLPVTDSLRGAQGMMCLALVSAAVAGYCYLAWISGTHHRAPVAACLFTMLTGALIAGGCSVYSSHYGVPSGWAYWLSVASSPVFILTGLMTTVTVCQGVDSINRHDYTPEMMFEAMGNEKQLLTGPRPYDLPFPQQPQSPHHRDPPMSMDYNDPTYDGPKEIPMDEFPTDYKY